jgi:hypothetical protein
VVPFAVPFVVPLVVPFGLLRVLVVHLVVLLEVPLVVPLVVPVIVPLAVLLETASVTGIVQIKVRRAALPYLEVKLRGLLTLASKYGCHRTLESTQNDNIADIVAGWLESQRLRC